MGGPKSGISKKGEVMHYSVGAIIREKKGNERFLLIERALPPLGFACIAGHIDKQETLKQALKREIEEECGLTLVGAKKLVEEELDWNWCSKGITTHYWHLFECIVRGELVPSTSEVKSAGWYTRREMQKLKLEPVWRYWFRKLELL